LAVRRTSDLVDHVDCFGKGDVGSIEQRWGWNRKVVRGFSMILDTPTWAKIANSNRAPVSHVFFECDDHAPVAEMSNR
jgi:hypothetical protein